MAAAPLATLDATPVTRSAGLTLGSGLARVPRIATGTMAADSRLVFLARGSSTRFKVSSRRLRPPTPTTESPPVSSTNALALAMPFTTSKSTTAQRRSLSPLLSTNGKADRISADATFSSVLSIRPFSDTTRSLPSSPAMSWRTLVPAPVTLSVTSAVPSATGFWPMAAASLP